MYRCTVYIRLCSLLPVLSNNMRTMNQQFLEPYNNNVRPPTTSELIYTTCVWKPASPICSLQESPIQALFQNSKDFQSDSSFFHS